MDDIFYGILLIFAVLFVFGRAHMTDFSSNFQKLESYQGYIVVEKHNPTFFGRTVKLRRTVNSNADTLSIRFRCEQLMYKNLSVGDTISEKHYTKYNNIVFE